ncbi:uncharacterized protein LOC130866489 [Chionomys nivalis]|uniref:uncharacterized protein LOC130866489 n=1 Tax=Chionomys nivalis TaxID=269649 RepID=UPI002599BB0F|nr:uncharacterized protein LOC130866489 [Chionomys nivalis]
MFCGATQSTKPPSRQQGSDPDVTRAGLLAGQVQRKSPESRPLAHVPRSPLPPAAPRFLSKQTLGGGDCQGRAQRPRNPATSPKHRPRSGPAGLHRGSAPLSGIGGSGDGITECPERLAAPAQSLARTQRVVITAQRTQSSLDTAATAPPLQIPSRGEQMPGLRSPPTALRRSGPRRSHGPSPGMGLHSDGRGRLGLKAVWTGEDILPRLTDGTREWMGKQANIRGGL